MNRDIFDMFDNFELDQEDMTGYKVSADRISQMTLQKIAETKQPASRRRKIWRTALLAAVIACFLSVTAYAAAYFSMHYSYVEKGETYHYQYWTPEGYREASYTVSNSYIVSFDTQPVGYLYAFRPTWVPQEPTHSWSLYDEVTGQVLYNGADEAALLAELDMTADEAASWYTWFDADEIWDPDAQGPNYDVPYQVWLYGNNALYNTDFAIGDDAYDNEDVKVDFVKDEVNGDWHEIWVHVDETETWHAKQNLSFLDDTNLVLRFNLAEGYLVFVPGTLDLETLHKIAENVEVLRTNLPAEIQAVDGERRHSCFNLAHG